MLSEDVCPRIGRRTKRLISSVDLTERTWECGRSTNASAIVSKSSTLSVRDDARMTCAKLGRRCNHISEEFLADVLSSDQWLHLS